MQQIHRIQEMEQIFNEVSAALSDLQRALDAYRALESKLAKLEAYYTSPAWQADYADDEAGRLPQGLPRGVLSQDGVYDLLSRRDALLQELTETSQKSC